MKLKRRRVDFRLHGQGADSVFLLQPVSKAGEAWAAEHLPADAQRLGPSIAIEHRYLPPIIEGLQADGLVIGDRTP